MSVTGFMYNVNATKNLAELELKEGFEGSNSWHHQFKDSAYVYIGGLHLGLTEGDVVIMFSQFGEIVDVNVIRDKTTGKSKGFAFICYEDQRSTVLAVDNMNGFQLLGRTIRVDHVEKYKCPKKFDENEVDADGDKILLDYEATGAEGKGYKVYNALETQKKITEVSDQRRKPQARPQGPEDEDEAWAKSFEASLKSIDEVPDWNSKHKKKKKDLKQDKNDLMKVLEETKRLKKEAKQAKEEAKRRKEGKKVKQEEKDGKHSGGRKAAKSEEKSSSSSSSSSSSDDSSEKPKKARKR